MAEVVEAGDVLPAEVLAESLSGNVDRAPDPAAATPKREPTPFLTAEAALHALRGQADLGLAIMRGLDYQLVEGAHSPWQYPAFLPRDILAEGIVPFSGGPTITSPASWFYLAAIEGLALDVRAGRLTVAPRLPAAWRSLEAPVFAPTFWGWLEYRPGRNRTTLIFRFDRFLPEGVSSTIAAHTADTTAKTDFGTASLVLKQVVLPAVDPQQARVEASLGRAPLPGKTTRDARGRLVFTFDVPVSLSSGQRLEFVVR